MKNLLYVLVFLSLAVALVGECATLSERVAELKAATGVEAVQGGAASDLVPYAEVDGVTWHIVDVVYLSSEGAVLKKDSIRIWVKAYGEAGEAAFFERRIPEPVREKPVEEEKVATEEEILTYLKLTFSGKGIYKSEVEIRSDHALATVIFETELGVLSEKVYFIKRDDKGALTHKDAPDLSALKGL